MPSRSSSCSSPPSGRSRSRGELPAPWTLERSLPRLGQLERRRPTIGCASAVPRTRVLTGRALVRRCSGGSDGEPFVQGIRRRLPDHGRALVRPWLPGASRAGRAAPPSAPRRPVLRFLRLVRPLRHVRGAGRGQHDGREPPHLRVSLPVLRPDHSHPPATAVARPPARRSSLAGASRAPSSSTTSSPGTASTSG